MSPPVASPPVEFTPPPKMPSAPRTLKAIPPEEETTLSFEEQKALAKYGDTDEERHFTRWVPDGRGNFRETLYDWRGARILTTRRVNGRLLPAVWLVLIAVTLAWALARHRSHLAPQDVVRLEERDDYGVPSSPGGRQRVAQDASPGMWGRLKDPKPGGRQLRGTSIVCRPPGWHTSYRLDSQGCAALALGYQSCALRAGEGICSHDDFQHYPGAFACAKPYQRLIACGPLPTTSCELRPLTPALSPEYRGEGGRLGGFSPEYRGEAGRLGTFSAEYRGAGGKEA